jgi:glycosyltransferase involved in cell wall biosynthesis
MKILWMSDSPTAPSGFGNVTRFVCAGLAELGHTVSILGWQARGTPSAWQGCTVYPVRHDSFGADVLLTYLQKLQPEVLITLADVWWLTFIANPSIANFLRTAGIPWALYYPIDGDMGAGRLPPSWVRVLETVDLPIAMSRYGRDVTQANGVTPAYIPHGVDTRVFCPPVSKEAAKRALGYDGKFVILSDARNQPRKLLPRTLEIFRRFASGKDDVLLHLHCDPNDPAAQTPEYAYDLRADIALLGLTDAVRLTAGMTIDAGLPLDRLAALYQAADVHLLASWGEGFGLPTLQAAATGVVPLASDYTASRELVLGHGEPIRVRAFVPDQFGLRRALIDVDDAVQRLEALYRDRHALAVKARNARRFAEAYEWGRVVPQWHELLQREVPRLRQKVARPAPTARIRLHAHTVEGPRDAACAVRAALPALYDGVQVTLNIVEGKAGQLTAEVFRDALASRQSLTIPVTLPSADPALAEERVTGCVYLAGPADVPVVRQLGQLFPRLNAWSTAELDLGVGQVSGRPVKAKAVPLHHAAHRRHLAASTLALDLGGVDETLPQRAAELGVPCLGLAHMTSQRALWPDLCLPEADVGAAVLLARALLTDQAEAQAACDLARQRLALAEEAR